MGKQFREADTLCAQAIYNEIRKSTEQGIYNPVRATREEDKLYTSQNVISTMKIKTKCFSSLFNKYLLSAYSMPWVGGI